MDDDNLEKCGSASQTESVESMSDSFDQQTFANLQNKLFRLGLGVLPAWSFVTACLTWLDWPTSPYTLYNLLLVFCQELRSIWVKGCLDAGQVYMLGLVKLALADVLP